MQSFNTKTEVSSREPSTSVSVQDVSVEYRVKSQKNASQGKLGAVRNLIPKKRRRVHALSNINLTANKGDSVGVLGLNGSGKSTLLRVIAGLETPKCGRVLATTQPTLLGVSAALEPALSGLQNIRLGCLAIGMHPKDLPAAIDEITEFVDIGDSLNYPMNTYSSGMAARLRFAIATAANPEILLIDEALATGDAAFKRRSRKKMEKLQENAGTVFLVSHQAQTIEELCSRAIWIHKGHLIAQGSGSELAREYRRWAWALANNDKKKAERLIRPHLESAGSDHEPSGG